MNALLLKSCLKPLVFRLGLSTSNGETAAAGVTTITGLKTAGEILENFVITCNSSVIPTGQKMVNIKVVQATEISYKSHTHLHKQNIKSCRSTESKYYGDLQKSHIKITQILGNQITKFMQIYINQIYKLWIYSENHI